MRSSVFLVALFLGGCSAVLDFDSLRDGHGDAGHGELDSGNGNDGGGVDSGMPVGTCIAPTDGPFFDYAKPHELSLGAQNYAIGLGTGDLDGDGAPEILVLESNDNNVHVYEDSDSMTSERAGAFWPSGCSATPRHARVVAADVTGDGLVDVLVACSNTGDSPQSELTLLKNVGNGSLSPGVAFTVEPVNPFGLVVADIDGDKTLDVVATTNDTLAGANIYWGSSGDVTSATPTMLTIPAGVAYDVAAAPLGSGGEIGVLVLTTGSSSQTGTVELFRPQVEHTFDSPESVLLPAPPAAFVVGNFDGSGRTGFVYVTNDGKLYRAEGTMGPNGTAFSEPSQPLDTPLEGSANLGGGDLNCDGLVDLVVTEDPYVQGTYEDNWAVYTSHPTGLAPAPSPGGYHMVGSGQPDTDLVTIADVNHDRRPDIVMTLVFQNSATGGSLRVVHGLAALP